MWSTDVLRDPAGHSLHLPWARAARERLDGLDWALLEAVAQSSTGTFPDFPSPPPTTPLADIDAELARVRATDPAQAAHELRAAHGAGGPPPAARVLLADPDAGLERLVAEMRGYWERCLAPWWPRIRAALEDDITHRARRDRGLRRPGSQRALARRRAGDRPSPRARRAPGGARPAARARRLRLAA